MTSKLFLTMFCFFPLCSVAPAVSLAGVEVQLGMATDTALAKFVGVPNVQIYAEPKLGWYTVLGKNDPVGVLEFQSDKLVHVQLFKMSSYDGVDLVKKLYDEVSAAQTTGVAEIRTQSWGNASDHSFDIHLVFKDREVVVSTSSHDGKDGVSVSTHFPRESPPYTDEKVTKPRK